METLSKFLKDINLKVRCKILNLETLKIFPVKLKIFTLATFRKHFIKNTVVLLFTNIICFMIFGKSTCVCVAKIIVVIFVNKCRF